MALHFTYLFGKKYIWLKNSEGNLYLSKVDEKTEALQKKWGVFNG